MEITAYPMQGGEYSTYSLDKGNYRCKVTDASYGEAKTGRQQLILDLTVEGDPNHPAKEGKRLTRHYQSVVMPASDDADKIKTLKGFWKRMISDGFALKWDPLNAKPFDPRTLIGKIVFVQIGNTKRADGSPAQGVVALAPTADKLPAVKIDTGTGAAAAVGGNGAAGGRRRR